MSAATTAKPRSSATSEIRVTVIAAATPPAADATSSSIPRRRLIRLSPSGAGRHGARRRDDGDEADRRGDLEVEAERRVEERDQEHAAAKAEQRAETSGDGAGAHDDRDDGG